MRRLAALAALAPLLCACQAGMVAPRSQPERMVYAAIGASDTVGVGSRDPARDAWPAVFARTTLPGAEVHNLGISGATTAEAIRRELPAALALRPTIATVWLNVNDLTHGVDATTYGHHLRHLLGALRRGGRTRVLVATTPRLESLPAYRSCVGAPAWCAFGSLLPSPSAVRDAVDRYKRRDPFRRRTDGRDRRRPPRARGRSTHASGLGRGDSSHPSTEGYRHVAAAFAAALRTA